MFDNLNKLLKRFSKEEPDSDESQDQQIAQIAAMLLLEVAWADHDIEERELELIRGALQSLYKIDPNHVENILKQAQLLHESATDIHSLTSTLNEELDIDERRQLLVNLWRLNDFEGGEFHYEENVIRRIANLLYLHHSDFIAAKLEAQKQS